MNKFRAISSSAACNLDYPRHVVNVILHPKTMQTWALAKQHPQQLILKHSCCGHPYAQKQTVMPYKGKTFLRTLNELLFYCQAQEGTARTMLARF